MEDLKWRLKLVILWVFQVINFITALLFFFMETGGFLRGVKPGNDNATGNSIYFLVLFIMACLSFFAKPKVSRWPNIILGLVMLNYKVGAMFGVFGNPSPGIMINEIWGGIAAVLIIWYGWKIPKTEAKVEIT